MLAAGGATVLRSQQEWSSGAVDLVITRAGGAGADVAAARRLVDAGALAATALYVGESRLRERVLNDGYQGGATVCSAGA